MTETVTPVQPSIARGRPFTSYVVVALLSGLIGAGLAVLRSRPPGTNPENGNAPLSADAEQTSGQPARSASVRSSENFPAPASAEEAADTPDLISIPASQWAASGIRILPVASGSFQETIRLTGKVSLNEDRIAHIYPMVEGTADTVSVGLGDFVQADDLLVIVHSREIGEAKLALYQARLQHELALTRNGIQQEVAANVRRLLASLRTQEPITSIEETFRGHSMGDYRERLLLAYSSYLKSAADVERLSGPAESGAVSAKQLFAAQSSRNADLATFQARIEQIEHELTTSLLLSSQAVREAATRVAVAATSLRILGCGENEIDSIAPEEQGEAISHYFIRAPFDGTVIAKDLVLKEQVRPDKQILSIADLSTVWITADIYEQNVPLLNSLSGKTVRVRNDAWPDRQFEARIFYTGEIMDATTRTISMRSVADNSERLLKPGMFVQIEIEASENEDVLTVPLAAVQEHEGKTFVFLQHSQGMFERRSVRLGRRNQDQAIVLDGLTAGDPVVTSGGFILKSRMLADLLGEE